MKIKINILATLLFLSHSNVAAFDLSTSSVIAGHALLIPAALLARTYLRYAEEHRKEKRNSIVWLAYVDKCLRATLAEVARTETHEELTQAFIHVAANQAIIDLFEHATDGGKSDETCYSYDRMFLRCFAGLNTKNCADIPAELMPSHEIQKIIDSKVANPGELEKKVLKSGTNLFKQLYPLNDLEQDECDDNIRTFTQQFEGNDFYLSSSFKDEPLAGINALLQLDPSTLDLQK